MRVLIVRFSAIGDCAIAAWPVSALRARHPEAFIGWAAETRCLPVVDEVRLTSERHEIPRERWKRQGPPGSTLDTLRTYLRLRPYSYELGIDLQGHFKTALCLRLSGARRRWAVRATDAVAARMNRRLDVPDHGPHEMDLYAAVAERLGWGPLPERPLMPALPVLEVPAGPLATIQTGAGFEDKRYPVALWDQVAEGLLARGFAVWAIGAPNDPRLTCAGVHDRVGQFDLRQSMAAIAQSTVHLAGDTGTGHLASALGTPVVSIFGPTGPERFRPWTSNGRVLREGLDPANVDPARVVEATLDLIGHASISH